MPAQRTAFCPARRSSGMENSCIKELALLNTIPAPENAPKKIRYIDVAPVFADAIQRIYEETSMSVLF